MVKQITLAVAGSGKTYAICNKINKNYKNLIIAFTRQNISNIKNELRKIHGKIPDKTKVMTFHSFVYQFFVLPYGPSFFYGFNSEYIKTSGITFKDPPNRIIKKCGYRIPNKNYHNKNNILHYLYCNKFYCSLMTQFCIENKKIVNKAAKNINKFFDEVYIDEFQDFRQNDYKFLIQISKKINNFYAVGDFYQHSVNGKNNTGVPFKKRKKYVTYDEYIALLKKEKFDVDNTCLKTSRRCSSNVCKFIRDKLGINIISAKINKGNVEFIKSEKIENILNDDSIIKLVEKNSAHFNFKSINWGYSKGDTYKSICVILTKSCENIDDDNFVFKGSFVSLNKLYVALSRTKGNLYIIKKSEFDKVKSKYIN